MNILIHFKLYIQIYIKLQNRLWKIIFSEPSQITTQFQIGLF